MCANNLLLEIATYVGTAEPQTFDALVSKASNVERQVARQKSSAKIQVADKKSDSKKTVVKKGETMATFVRNERKNDTVQNNQRKNDSVKSKNDNNRVQSDRPRKLTLDERKNVTYSFDDEDVEVIFDELIASESIKLPESK